MALGGIPYYWSFLKKGMSVAQNFDRIFFQPGGELTQEFDALYASLFKKPRCHIAIITALAKKKQGLLREELLKASKLSDNADFSKALQETGAVRFHPQVHSHRQEDEGCDLPAHRQLHPILLRFHIGEYQW